MMVGGHDDDLLYFEEVLVILISLISLPILLYQAPKARYFYSVYITESIWDGGTLLSLTTPSFFLSSNNSKAGIHLGTSWSLVRLERHRSWRLWRVEA